MLAWRSVRLHAAEASQAARFGSVSERLRRLSMKSVVAAATMTPITQVLASCALAAVIVAALWQSGRGGSTVGGFVAFIVAHAAADRRRSSTSPRSPGRSRAAWRRSTAASA